MTAPASVDVGDTAAFSIWVSPDPGWSFDYSPTVEWNFGDGSYAAYSGEDYSHVYTGPGTYEVTATSTDYEHAYVPTYGEVPIYSYYSCGFFDEDTCSTFEGYAYEQTGSQYEDIYFESSTSTWITVDAAPAVASPDRASTLLMLGLAVTLGGLFFGRRFNRKPAQI